MFDRVVDALRRGYHDTAFTRDSLTRLREEFRPAALVAAGPAEERDVIWRMLTRIPASHLTLLSRRGYTGLLQDVAGQRRVMMGMQLIQVDGRYFATTVLNGGPAAMAGVNEWDEIVRVNDVLPHQSSHVDPRSDEAYFPDERDPPTHGINAPFGDTVRLHVVRAPAETLTVRVAPKLYSTLEATRASVRLTVRNGVRVGYIHWWFMSRGVPAGFDAALAGPLAPSQALLLDLRGRGGVEAAVTGILRLLGPGRDQRFQGPIVALIDGHTRSAKEQLAYELRARELARLVGEATAGAYLPADFATISDDVILMFPKRNRSYAYYSTRIEQHPVTPDVAVQSAGPYSGRGRDPILDAGLDEAVRLVVQQGPGRTLTGKTAK